MHPRGYTNIHLVECGDICRDTWRIYILHSKCMRHYKCSLHYRNFWTVSLSQIHPTMFQAERKECQHDYYYNGDLIENVGVECIPVASKSNNKKVVIGLIFFLFRCCCSSRLRLRSTRKLVYPCRWHMLAGTECDCNDNNNSNNIRNNC